MRNVFDIRSVDLEPQYVLQFPCVTQQPTQESLNETLSSFVNVEAPKHPQLEEITLIRSKHVEQSNSSLLSMSAVIIPLGRIIDLPYYNTGISASTWIKTE